VCYFDVPALRDLSLEQLEEKHGLLNQTLYNRARHVISANRRVMEAEQAMRNGDAAALGRLMNASHESMRDDYEISREEMDLMVSIAQDQSGCFGARMTGGGFGGCAIALVEEDQVDLFRSKVARRYFDKTGLEANIYIANATDGTSYE
jgi:galactokinase